MMKRIRKWLKSIFVTKYVIARNGIIKWHLIYSNRTVIRYTKGKTELLTSWSFTKDWQFGRALKKADVSNAIWSFIQIKILINRQGDKYRFKRVRANDVVFLTDLTGLTGN